MIKNLLADTKDAREKGSAPGLGRSLSRRWQPTLGFFLEKFHGQRSLAVYSPWGHRESDNDWATEQQQANLPNHLPRAREILSLNKELSKELNSVSASARRTCKKEEASMKTCLSTTATSQGWSY